MPYGIPSWVYHTLFAQAPKDLGANPGTAKTFSYNPIKGRMDANGAATAVNLTAFSHVSRVSKLHSLQAQTDSGACTIGFPVLEWESLAETTWALTT